MRIEIIICCVMSVDMIYLEEHRNYTIPWDLRMHISELSLEFHQTEFTTFEKGFLGILIKYNVQEV